MQGRARPAWAAATVASRTARPPGPPREPASGAPPCALAPLGSSGSSLSPWFLLQCSPPCPLWPFAPAACRPPLLALSAGPSVRAGHPKPNFRAERNCPGRGAAGRPRRGPLDNLSQVGALALSSARLAAAVQSLPRGTGLGRHLSPRRRGKRDESVFAPYPPEAAQKSLHRAHWAGRGLGPSREPGGLAGRPAPGFTPPRGWLGFLLKRSGERAVLDNSLKYLLRKKTHRGNRRSIVAWGVR